MFIPRRLLHSNSKDRVNDNGCRADVYTMVYPAHIRQFSLDEKATNGCLFQGLVSVIIEKQTLRQRRR